MELGYELEDVSPEGIGHRFVSIDVLGPDGLGERADLRTLQGARTVRVPGGTQALRRKEDVEIRTRTQGGIVPVPNLLGAILVKVRAIEVDDQPEAQRRDVAFLLSVVEDPDTFTSEVSQAERKWFRRHSYFSDPADTNYRGIARRRMQRSSTGGSPTLGSCLEPGILGLITHLMRAPKGTRHKYQTNRRPGMPRESLMQAAAAWGGLRAPPPPPPGPHAAPPRNSVRRRGSGVRLSRPGTNRAPWAPGRQNQGVHGSARVVGVVPAAGFAHRLGDLDGSKEMLPIAGRPLIDYLVQRMVTAGCDELRVVTRPEKTDVVDRAAELGAKVVLARPGSIAESLLMGIDGLGPTDIVLVGFPDTIWEPPEGFRLLLDLVVGEEADAALGLFRWTEAERSDVVACDRAGRVTSITVRPRRPSSPWIWGCMATRRSTLSDLRPDGEVGAYLNQITGRLKIVGRQLSDVYVDFGTQETLSAYGKLSYDQIIETARYPSKSG